VDVGLDDFLVSEGGREREVLDVHVADYPIALLLDDTQDEAVASTIRSAAIRFIERVGERPFAVATLSSAESLVATFDDERSEVVKKLADTPLGGGRPVALLPAVANAAAHLRALDMPFSAIVVVTATTENAAVTDGRALPSILEANAPVLVVMLQPGSPNPGATPGQDVFRALAEQTHGQYTPIFNPASFSIALDRLADRLSSEMMISVLIPPGATPGDVRIGVRKPGLRVLGLGVSK
jgi:hypothetical protein